mgnify:CR=1 FL=1
MKVAVKLHGILRDYRPRGSKIDQFELAFDAPATVLSAVQHFGIPPQKVHAVFLNDEPAELTSMLKDGDHIRLFPPVVGGAPWRVFVAGIMQGSRRENDLDAQDYRRIIGEVLRAHLPQVEVIDPLELHPNSLTYDLDAARETLIGMAATAGAADAVVAYVPSASMGTALEMWEAYHHSKPVFTISPLRHNWVVQALSTRVLDDLEQFTEFVRAGEFERMLRDNRRADQ